MTTAAVPRGSKKRRLAHATGGKDDEVDDEGDAATTAASTATTAAVKNTKKQAKTSETGEDAWSAIARRRQLETSTSGLADDVETLEACRNDFAAWSASMRDMRMLLSGCDWLTGLLSSEASYEEIMEAAFMKGKPLHDDAQWPSIKSKVSSYAIELIKACAKAFDSLNAIGKDDVEDDWTKNERSAATAMVRLLTFRKLPRVPVQDKDMVTAPKQIESYISTLREEIKVEESTGGIRSTCKGRTILHVEAMIQAFKIIKTSMECCARTLYLRFLKPLHTYTRGDIQAKTFPSNIYFVCWANLTVNVACDLCAERFTRQRMEAYAPHKGDFQQLIRELTDKLYVNIPSNIPEAIKYEQSGKYWSRDLVELVQALPELKITIPVRQRFEHKVRRDVKSSEKFQKKLARLAFDCIGFSTSNPVLIELSENDENFTNAIIEVLKKFKSHSVKLIARDSLLKLNRHLKLALEVSKITKQIIQAETADEVLETKLSSALTMLSVMFTIDSKELANTSSLVPLLINVFELRNKCAGLPNFDIEAQVCSLLACLAIGQNRENLRAQQEGNFNFVNTTVQTAVAQRIDSIGPIVCDLLRHVRSTTISRVKKNKHKVEQIGVSVLAALAMFTRKNEELQRAFKDLGVIDLLLGILERKDVHCSRGASAAILAMGEHRQLLRSLYEPTALMDDAGERITDVSGWNIDALRRSLRAIAELIKDSPSSLMLVDQITELICEDWQLIIIADFIRDDITRHTKVAGISSRKCEEFTRKLLRREVIELDSLVDSLQGEPDMTVKERNNLDGNLDVDRLYEDCDVDVDVNAHYFPIVKSGCILVKYFKNRAPLDEITDILMEVDTSGRGASVGVIPPLLTLMQKCRRLHENNLIEEKQVPGIADIEKEACYVIGLLAGKTVNQNKLVRQEDALEHPPSSDVNVEKIDVVSELVPLLERCHPSQGSGPTASVARRAADAITNLAHENNRIKNIIRERGAIPPLVKLLDAKDAKLKRSAASALRTLAFKNGENKNQIVEHGALPSLIFMVRSADPLIHKEAVGVIGNLVHSSAHIKRRVLDQGALQPVIELLKSTCAESQREAALLLGQFAARLDPPGQSDPDYRTKIVQRGAVQSLIKMLHHRDPGLREMAAFALGRLAQLGDNQVGICHSGALQPLLCLLGSEIEDIADHIRSTNTVNKSEDDIENEAKRFVENLQHNAAFALYGLAENKDNIPKMIIENAYMRLRNCSLLVPTSEQCVTKTVKRIEEKIKDDVLHYLTYVIGNGKPLDRQRSTLALAFLCKPVDMPNVFLTHGGLDVIADMLLKDNPAEPLHYSGGSSKLVVNIAMEALRAIKRTMCTSNEDLHVVMPPRPSTPTAVENLPRNWYFKDPELSDITFTCTEHDKKDPSKPGTPNSFSAHRIAFAHASNEFLSIIDKAVQDPSKRMPNGVVHVELEDVDGEVLQCMLDFIYTGTVDELSPLNEQEFLQDKYLLILEHATRFGMVDFKYLFEKLFIEHADLACFSMEERIALYATAQSYDCKSLQEFILEHALDYFDRTDNIQELRTHVSNIISAFGQGMVTYVKSVLQRADVVAEAGANAAHVSLDADQMID